MICPNCKDSGVLNHANGIEFYYCRTCKVEIFLEDAPEKREEKPEKEHEYPWGIYFSNPHGHYPSMARSVKELQDIFAPHSGNDVRSDKIEPWSNGIMRWKKN